MAPSGVLGDPTGGSLVCGGDCTSATLGFNGKSPTDMPWPYWVRRHPGPSMPQLVSAQHGNGREGPLSNLLAVMGPAWVMGGRPIHFPGCWMAPPSYLRPPGYCCHRSDGYNISRLGGAAGLRPKGTPARLGGSTGVVMRWVRAPSQEGLRFASWVHMVPTTHTLRVPLCEVLCAMLWAHGARLCGHCRGSARRVSCTGVRPRGQRLQRPLIPWGLACTGAATSHANRSCTIWTCRSRMWRQRGTWWTWSGLLWP